MNPSLNYKLNTNTPENWKTDCLILPIFEDSDMTVGINDQLISVITQLKEAGDVTGKAGSSFLVPVDNTNIQRLLLVGAGKLEKFNFSSLKKVVQTAAGQLKVGASQQALFCLADLAKLDAAEALQQSVIAFDELFYQFNQFKSEPAPASKLTECAFHIAPSALDVAQAEIAISTGAAIAQGVQLAKTLGDLPANICTPSYLAEQAQALATAHKEVSVDVLEESDMEKLGMGALLSVSHGSVEPAKLIVLKYTGADDKADTHMLVGKGITFDSGGISLKPGAQMDEMKYDMCGAASVLGTMTAICALKPKMNIVTLIASAENMPAGNATKPGDIVTTMEGKTVEILNTDAEGRLVLCDALSYAKQFKPASIVDIATLTGACILALGHEVSGMLANDNEIAEELLTAGQQISDKAWQLPLWDEYQSQLDSNFADIQNIGGRPAGTITAACFLSRFTEGLNWAHLDIAGTAWTSGKAKGATGRPVPLLTRYMLNKA